MAQPIKIVTRQLGKNGPTVPRLGLGLMNSSGHYNLARPVEERLAFLDKAYEMGERFWDTAAMYGDSEEVLGKWFAANPEKRKDVIIGTKFGINVGPKGMAVDSSPEHCRESLERSLTRMGLSYVDIYYVHHLDRVTPIEKTIQAMVELKNEGKIKYFGLSECSADTLRRASSVHQITCVQMEYNPTNTEIETPERNFLQTARELGIAVIANSPLARGLLSGSIRSREDVTAAGDMRSHMPRFNGENLDHNLAVINELDSMAKSKNITVAQLLLGWLLAQGDDIFAIPGTTKVERLAENLGGMGVELTAEEEKKVREVGGSVKGFRIPENYDSVVNLFGDTPPLEA